MTGLENWPDLLRAPGLTNLDHPFGDQLDPRFRDLDRDGGLVASTALTKLENRRVGALAVAAKAKAKSAAKKAAAKKARFEEGSRQESRRQESRRQEVCRQEVGR